MLPTGYLPRVADCQSQENRSIRCLTSPPAGVAKLHIKHQNMILFRSELRSCVKVEVAVLGSPSLLARTVFVDVKDH